MEPKSEAIIIQCPSCGGQNRVPAARPGAPHCGKCGKPLPWLVPADEATFDAVARGSSLPVVVDFWAPWCGPCRIIEPALKHLATEMAGRIKVVKVNTDEAPSLSGSFDIKGIPTLVMMRDGKDTDRVSGALAEPALRQWLEARLGAPTPKA